MRCTKSALFGIGCSAIIALVTGCSGGGSSSSPALLSVPQGLTPGTGRAAAAIGFAGLGPAGAASVVVADPGLNKVSAYSAGGQLVAAITGLDNPEGVTADPSGNIYIANSFSNDVLVYKSDFTTLLTTLTDAGEVPGSVSFNPATGLVGVTNVQSRTAPFYGSVSMYASGTTVPCVTVTGPTVKSIVAGAFDHTGNLYVVGYWKQHDPFIGVVRGGCSASAVTILSSQKSPSPIGGVAVTPAGDIAVETGAVPVIQTYNPPVKNTLGSLITTTSLSNTQSSGAFSLSSSGNGLWAVNYGRKSISKYLFPAGGSATMTLTGFAYPQGVVSLPIEQP